MDAISAFPRRPLRVRLGFKQGAALAMAAIVGVAMLAGFLFLGATFGSDLLREPQVWREGREVPIEALEGSCRAQMSFLPLSYCSFALTYRAPGETIRTKEVLALVFADMAPRESATLKIDPENPDSVALSWLIDCLEERWIVLVGLCLIGLGLGASICAGLIRSLSEWRRYKAMGRSPYPILVAFLKKKHVANPNYAWEYSFRYEVDGVTRHGRQRLRVLKGGHGVPPEKWDYEVPIMVGKETALALLDPKGRALLVPQSFRPFVMNKDEVQNVLCAAGYHS